jgi:hypothetical protein
VFSCGVLRGEHRLRMFENRVLERIFGPYRNEIIESWRKIQKEQLHNLYTSKNIIRIMKSRRMKWAGYVARMGVVHIGFRYENLKERDH